MASVIRQYWKGILAAAGIAMLFYLPTREFLKVTFMAGIPFIFAWGFMSRQRRYSLPWVLAGIVILASLGGYGYLLVNLPERIQTRAIISEGGALVAEGKYDQAINEYKKLEEIGQTQKMQEKIQIAEKEKKANQQLVLARQLIKAGRLDDAKKTIESIPPDTRAAREAKKLKL